MNKKKPPSFLGGFFHFDRSLQIVICGVALDAEDSAALGCVVAGKLVADCAVAAYAALGYAAVSDYVALGYAAVGKLAADYAVAVSVALDYDAADNVAAAGNSVDRPVQDNIVGKQDKQAQDKHSPAQN